MYALAAILSGPYEQPQIAQPPSTSGQLSPAAASRAIPAPTPRRPQRTIRTAPIRRTSRPAANTGRTPAIGPAPRISPNSRSSTPRYARNCPRKIGSACVVPASTRRHEIASA